jgi:hypothetical protein
MLIRLGFHQIFIDLLMKCVCSVKYKIRVNNEFTPDIIPEWGLRKGDPLSPYLFLLCAEGFSSLLHQAEINEMIQGIKICQGAPSVTHLLFYFDRQMLLMYTNCRISWISMSLVRGRRLTRKNLPSCSVGMCQTQEGRN